MVGLPELLRRGHDDGIERDAESAHTPVILSRRKRATLQQRRSHDPISVGEGCAADSRTAKGSCNREFKIVTKTEQAGKLK